MNHHTLSKWLLEFLANSSTVILFREYQTISS